MELTTKLLSEDPAGLESKAECPVCFQPRARFSPTRTSPARTGSPTRRLRHRQPACPASPPRPRWPLSRWREGRRRGPMASAANPGKSVDGDWVRAYEVDALLHRFCRTDAGLCPAARSFDLFVRVPGTPCGGVLEAEKASLLRRIFSQPVT